MLEDEVKKLVSRMDRDVEAVIVEGRKDEEAMEKAGFTGKVYTCSENTSGLVSLGRRASRENSSLAILTDDDEGKKLNRELQEVVPEKINRKIWRKKLGKVLTSEGRRDVESINNVID
ncbi:MAG: toprim domain-containing protein [Candidatus Nanohaloarchaea archaeon]